MSIERRLLELADETLRETRWKAEIRKIAEEARMIEARIKQLEAVVNDPEVLWSNWLRGTVKLPSGIGDVRQYQARIKRLEEAGDNMAIYAELGGIPLQFVGVVNAWREAKEAKP